jgi:hypothetical protein
MRMADYVPDHLRESLAEVANTWLALAEQARNGEKEQV